MSKDGTCRIQFDLSRDMRTELDIMQKLTNEPTKSSLIINAMTFLAWAIEEVIAGRKIVSRDKQTGEFTIFLMPAFAEAEARRRYAQKNQGGET